jgi:hypothetical protein
VREGDSTYKNTPAQVKIRSEEDIPQLQMLGTFNIESFSNQVVTD